MAYLGLVPRRCLSGLECEEAHLLLEGELRAVLPLRPLRTLLLLRLQKPLLTRVPAKDNKGSVNHHAMAMQYTSIISMYSSMNFT